MTFSSDIRDTRRALRLTQSELAARLGVDKQTVSNWECGRCTPWAKEQVRVKEVLRGAPGLIASQNTAERLPQGDRAGPGAPLSIIDRIMREVSGGFAVIDHATKLQVAADLIRQHTVCDEQTALYIARRLWDVWHDRHEIRDVPPGEVARRFRERYES